MIDLRVSLAYTHNVTRNTGSELLADPSDDQPGWFVRATQNEGYDDVLKYTRIEPLTMLDVAHIIDRAAEGKIGRVTAAVAVSNNAHVRNLAEREARARSLIDQGQRILARIEAER